MALERLRADNAGFAIACGGGEESEERVLLVQHGWSVAVPQLWMSGRRMMMLCASAHIIITEVDRTQSSHRCVQSCSRPRTPKQFKFATEKLRYNFVTSIDM